MTKRQKLELEVQENKECLQKAEDGLKEHLQKTVMVVCSSPGSPGLGCGKKTSIGKLTYYQSYWMTGEPYDDTPRLGEGSTICPKCGKELRFIERTGNEKMPEYEHLFKERVDEEPRD